MKILIAEDDTDIGRSLSKSLREKGNSVSVVTDGDHALSKAIQHTFDVYIIDWRLPGKSGLEVCRGIREQGIATPVIFLTALSDVSNKVEALSVGADDYITKPFSLDELTARIHAVVRRADRSTVVRRIGSCSFDVAKRTVTGGRKKVHLSDKESDLLVYLIDRESQIVGKEEVLRNVWGHDFDTGTNVVEVTVKNLRKKLTAVLQSKCIKTVYGEGYVFLK